MTDLLSKFMTDSRAEGVQEGFLYGLFGSGGFRPNRLIWSWYRVAGRDTTRPYQAKLLLLLGLLRGVPESSVIAVGIDLDGDREAARQALRRFLAEGEF